MEFVRKKSFVVKNSLGMSLVEVLIALGIGGFVILGISSANTYVSNWYYQSVEENTAEENLLLAAFHLKQFLGQAVEVICSGGPLPSPVVLGINNAIPPYIGEGKVDCTYTVAAAVGNPSALAIFNRETGGVTSLVAGNFPSSQFVGSGIYFQPPAGKQSGVLSFAQAPPGSSTISLASALSLDHIVDIQALQFAISTSGRLETITYRLTARYMLQEGGTTSVSYLVIPPVGSTPYKNVTLDVDIGLRDNWLAPSVSGSGTSERLHGGLYYFRTIVPLAVNL